MKDATLLHLLSVLILFQVILNISSPTILKKLSVNSKKQTTTNKQIRNRSWIKYNFIALLDIWDKEESQRFCTQV